MTFSQITGDGSNAPSPAAAEQRAKTALALAKKLTAAEAAMTRFKGACVACGDRYPDLDDTRRTLAASMSEYAAYLERVYQK